MGKRAESFDATLGYRPPVRGCSRGGGTKAPSLQTPLPGVEERPAGRDAPPAPRGISKGKRAAAGIFLSAGFVLILGFSVASLLMASPAGPLAPQAGAPETVAAPSLRQVEKTGKAGGAAGVRLQVKNIMQEPELPNGCEATSLAVLLNYYGYPADKMDIVQNYMPKGDFWPGEWGEMYAPNPEQAYPGSPEIHMLGYYCYPGVIVETAGGYIAAQEGGHAAQDITGATTRRLRSLLDEGTPSVVWCTIDLLPPRTTAEFHWYFEQGGEPYYPYVNMHAMVLTGYDEQYYYFCDPLNNNNRVSRRDFDENYIDAGRRAVILVPAEEP